MNTPYRTHFALVILLAVASTAVYAEENKPFDANEAVKAAKIGVYAPREPATPPAPSYTIRDEHGRATGTLEPEGKGYGVYDGSQKKVGTVEPDR